MTTTEALALLKQAVTLIACDYDARCKLIEAIRTIEPLLPATPAPVAPTDPTIIEGEHGPGV